MYWVALGQPFQKNFLHGFCIGELVFDLGFFVCHGIVIVSLGHFEALQFQLLWRVICT